MITTQPKGFNYVLHGFRGIAASMVFFAHSLGGYFEHRCLECGGAETKALINVGTFGVELFFFLSGYVIYRACQKTDAATFSIRRFWRLYPVFILFTLLFFVLNAFTNQFPERNGVGFLLLNVTFLNLFFDTPALTPNAWTITYEVWYYVATYCLVAPMFGNLSKPWIVAGVILAGYFLVFHPITVFYLAGVAVSVFVERRPDWHHFISGRRLIICVQSALIVFTIYVASLDLSYVWQGLWENMQLIITVLALMFMMMSLLHPDSLFARSLQRREFIVLGTVSYTLYLAHPYSHIAARMFVEIVFGKLQETYWEFAIYGVINLTLTVILVAIVARYVEALIYEKYTGKKLFA